MSLTINSPSRESARAFQANFITHLTLDLDDSYPQAAGGYALDTALNADDDLSGHTILHVDVQETATHYFTYESNRLRVWIKGAPDAEAANLADLQAITGLVVTVFSE